MRTRNPLTHRMRSANKLKMHLCLMRLLFYYFFSATFINTLKVLLRRCLAVPVTCKTDFNFY